MRFFVVGVCALLVGLAIGSRRKAVPVDDSRIAALESASGAQAARLQALEAELAALRARPPEARAPLAPMPFEPDEMVAWIELAEARQTAAKAASEHEAYFAAMLEEHHATPEQARRLRELCAEKYRRDAALSGRNVAKIPDDEWKQLEEANHRTQHDAAAVLGTTDEDYPYCM